CGLGRGGVGGSVGGRGRVRGALGDGGIVRGRGIHRRGVGWGRVGRSRVRGSVGGRGRVRGSRVDGGGVRGRVGRPRRGRAGIDRPVRGHCAAVVHRAAEPGRVQTADGRVVQARIGVDGGGA